MACAFIDNRLYNSVLFTLTQKVPLSPKTTQCFYETRNVKSIEIYIFSLPLAAQWLPIDTLQDKQSSGACALSTLLLCISIHKLNNKHALKTFWEPSTTAGRCFHKGYLSSWVKPHFSVCRRLDALAPLQILTTKCPFNQNMQIQKKHSNAELGEFEGVATGPTGLWDESGWFHWLAVLLLWPISRSLSHCFQAASCIKYWWWEERVFT